MKIDDLLKESPELAPWRPRVGFVPQLIDAELVTLSVMQALLAFTSESRCRFQDSASCGRTWLDSRR